MSDRYDSRLAVQIAQLYLLRDRDKLTSLGSLQCAAWDDLIDVLDLEGLEQEDQLRLDLLAVLHELHVRHLEAVDDLAQDLQDAVQPGVLDLEDDGLGALLDDVARERDDQLPVLVLEALDE